MNILCPLMDGEGQAKAGALSRGKSLLTQLFGGKQSCIPQERKGSSLRSMSRSLLCCRKPLNKAAPQRLPEGPTVCLCGFFSLLKSCHYSSGPNYQPVCNTGQMLGRCCFFFLQEASFPPIILIMKIFPVVPGEWHYLIKASRTTSHSRYSC